MIATPPPSTSARLLEVCTPRALVCCHRLEAPILLFVVAGHGDGEAASRIVEWTSTASASGPLHVFHDWRRMTGYDSAARERLSRHVQEMGPRIASANLLVESRIMAMGVQVANMLLGGRLVTYSAREAFAAAMQASGATPAALADILE